MKYITLFLFFICPFCCVFAQSTILGQVDSEDSGDAVAEATVILKKEGNVVAQTQTDYHGNYAFRNIAEGNYKVVVVKSGYATIQVTEINILAYQQFELNPSFEYGSYDNRDTLHISYRELIGDDTEFGVVEKKAN